MPNIINRLQADLAAAHQELAMIEEQQRILRWKIQYIGTLLKSSEVEDVDILPINLPAHPSAPRLIRPGMTIAQVAYEILNHAEQPLPCLEIARRAMACGYGDSDLNIERARSHFSAVISKEIRSDSDIFWQVDRGLIGLKKWRSEKPDLERS